MTFLIDSDTAGDDVASLLFGLRWPGVTLEAPTIAAGNVHLHQAVRNALITVETAERTDVPVHPGADRPLLKPLVTAHYVHGDDGMGNSNFPPPNVVASSQHAVDAILDIATRHAGEIEIIAQAPLTNLALAFMKDPELPAKVRRLWIMGGSNNALGNITPAAEFNFYVDPDAAHIVMNAGFTVTLVPWDVCLRDGVIMRAELGPILEMGSELSEFYLAVNRAAWDFMRTHSEGAGIDGISHPDSLMMAMAIDGRVIVDSANLFVDVEHRGELTSGYSLVDVNGVLHRPPNAEVVLRANKERFKEMLIELLRS
ncbi:MAG: nucleoside hydrolase [Actinomycetota bacterium]